MQPSAEDSVRQKAARVAGLAHLVTFAFIAYAQFGISPLLYRGDPIIGLVEAEETARNILAQLPLLRLSIVLSLIWCAGAMVVLAAFYLILRPFGQTSVLVAAACQVLFAGAWAMGTAEYFTTMRLLSGGGDLRGFTDEQLQALASLTPSVFWDHYYVAMFFWGLATALFSYLWLRSRYIPRAFAIAGIAAGALGTLCAVSYTAFWNSPEFVVLQLLDTPLAIFQIALSVLLLVRRLRQPAGPDRAPART
jgi:hypothetical protein